MARAATPDHGELLDFEIQPDGSVVLHVSDIEDDYAHRIKFTRREIAGIAEASAEAFRTRSVACERCHLDRPAFEISTSGICVVCIMGR